MSATWIRVARGSAAPLKARTGAASWNPANAGRTFIDISALAPDPVNADTIYTALSIDGVFKSADRGANWTKLATFQLSRDFGSMKQRQAPQHFLNFFPLPHGHGSLRPIF